VQSKSPVTPFYDAQCSCLTKHEDYIRKLCHQEGIAISGQSVCLHHWSYGLGLSSCAFGLGQSPTYSAHLVGSGMIISSLSDGATHNVSSSSPQAALAYITISKAQLSVVFP
jgi:hypothetical protein